MRILMVQRFDLSNVGCGERIWRQAEVLAARGHDLCLVHFPHLERRRTLPALRPEIPPGVRGIALDRRSTRLLENKRILAEEIRQADLVHLWKAYPDTALPVLWNLIGSSKPLHYDWDDLEGGPGGIAERLTGAPALGRLLSRWEQEILGWAQTVTVASRQIEELCLESGFPPDRIFPGPVGATRTAVDPALRNRWETTLGGRVALVFVGQMEAEDFPLEILEAAAAVLRRVPDSVLVMVGDGGGRSPLQARSQQLGIADRVLFTGYVPRSEAQAILSLATVFLFPLADDLMSRCKSPLVVIEALSQGVPVVGSAVGEVPRMVGEAGVLVEGLAVGPWAEALVCLLADPARREDCGRKAQARFEAGWTWQASVDSLEQAYRCALEGIPASP